MYNDDLTFDAALKQRWLAAGLALALTCGIGVTTAPSAQAAPNDILIKAPRTSVPPTIDAASGSSQLLRSLYDGWAGRSNYQVSTDGGVSWNAANVQGQIVRPELLLVKGGVVTYQADWSGTVSRFDFNSNTSKVLRKLPSAPDAIGESAVLFRGQIDDDGTGLAMASLLNEDPPRVLNFTRPRLPGYASSELGVGSNSAFVATTSTSDAGEQWADGYLARAPFSGASSVSVKVPGLAAMAVRDDQAVYVTGTKAGASVCFRSPTAAGTWGAASCATLKAGDQRRVQPTLRVGPDWAAVRLSEKADADQFVVRGRAAPVAPVLIKPPKGVDRITVYGAGDSSHPLVNVVATAGSYLAYYRSDGSLDRIAEYEAGQSWYRGYALTPGAVLATDGRPTVDTPGELAWSRPIANGVAGTEEVLPIRSLGGLQASGDRVIINGFAGPHLLDRGAIVRKMATTAEGSKLSGAYYITDVFRGSAEVRRVDGARMLAGPVIDIFGSLALKRAKKKNTYQVVDVTNAIKTVTFTPPPGAPPLDDVARLWGDWVAYQGLRGDETVVFNYRKPGKVYRYPARLAVTGNGLGVLGDGFAVLATPREGDSQNMVAWDFVKNTTQHIASTVTTPEVAIDGSHRAAIMTRSGDLMVRELTTGGRSKPRLLGLIAPTTLGTAAWKLEIDATKALGKGTLTIKNSKGKAVHTVAVKAAPNGSIRDISWNGLTKTGTRAPAGTYTWELIAPASDGTGNLVRVDGTSALKKATGISGTIKVTSKSLGTVKGSTPKISDTTPVVGQTLTVKPGTWKPTPGVTLSYTWYRDKKAISGATRTTYTVTTGDVGQKLTVKVTGTMDGWKTATKTSKATARVKRK